MIHEGEPGRHKRRSMSQRKVKNPCKGTCSHLCLLRPGGYTCACPEGTSFISGSNTECDAGFEPPPTMPPPCQCQNGGTCYFDDNMALCKCPPAWKGDYCQTSINHLVASSVGIAVGVTVLIVALLVGLVYASRKKSVLMERLQSSLPSMPSMPSMPKFSGFRTGSSQNGQTTEGNESRQDLDTVSSISVSMVDTEVKNFENPGYEAEGQLDSNSKATPTSHPFSIKKPNIVNPLYGEGDQAADDTAKSSSWSSSSPKGVVIHSPEDIVPSSSQVAMEQIKPTVDESSKSFQNPIYTDDEKDSPSDSDV